MKIIKLILFTFISCQLYSQPYSLDWHRTYDFPTCPKTYAPSVCKSSVDGSFWVGGRRDSVLPGNMVFLRKYDSNGNFLLDRTIPHASNIDAGALATDKDGNVYLGCNIIINSTDILLNKYDSSGTLIWQFNYDDSLHGSNYINNIQVDSFLNVYILGVTPGASQNQLTSFTAKIDSSGNLIWLRKLNPTMGTSTSFVLAQDNQNRILTIEGFDSTHVHYFDTAGNMLSAWTDDSSNTLQLPTYISDDSGNVIMQYKLNNNLSTVRKYDSNGNILWQTQINGYFNKIVLDNPYFYLTGTYGPDFYLSKLNLSGNLIWAKQYFDSTPALISKFANSFVLSNQRLYLSGFNSDTSNSFDSFIHQFDTSGNLLRNRVFNYLQGDETHYVACANTYGKYLYTANSIRHILQSNYILFVCDSAMQDTVYENLINYQHARDGNYRIHLNPDNTIVQDGLSGDTTGAQMIAILKYDVNGNLLWTMRESFMDNALLSFGNMIVDNNQNYIAYGTLGNQGSSGSYVCMVDSSGVLQWSKLIHFFYGNYSNSNSMACDNAGGLYLYVSKKDSSGIYPSYINKINYNGNSIWSKKIDSIPAGNTNSINLFYRYNILYMLGETIAPKTGSFYFTRSDASGNILQCIELSGPLSNKETKGKMIQDSHNNFIIYGSTADTIASINPTSWYITKIDSMGNLFWDKKFTSSSGTYDAPVTACADDNDNIYISGNAEDGTPNPKWMLRKLDPGGNVLWEDSLPFAISAGSSIAYNDGQLHVAINKRNDPGSFYFVYDTAGVLLYSDTNTSAINDIIPSIAEVYLAGNVNNDSNYYDMVIEKYINLISDILITRLPSESLNAYPNPAVREINLNFNIVDQGEYSIQVLDQRSSVIYSKKITCHPGKNNATIPLPEIANGVVYFTVTGDNYLSSRKVVINK